MKKYPDNNCLGWRVTGEDGSAGPYHWLSYKQVAAKVELIGSALTKVGLEPKGRVGIFSSNCPEWMQTMQVRSLSRCTLCMWWCSSDTSAPGSKKPLTDVATCD